MSIDRRPFLFCIFRIQLSQRGLYRPRFAIGPQRAELNPTTEPMTESLLDNDGYDVPIAMGSAHAVSSESAGDPLEALYQAIQDATGNNLRPVKRIGFL